MKNKKIIIKKKKNFSLISKFIRFLVGLSRSKNELIGQKFSKKERSWVSHINEKKRNELYK